MSYLDLLTIQSDWKNVKAQIDRFEQQTHIVLPPVFKTFLYTYDTKNVNKAELLAYYHPTYDANIQFYQSEFNDDENIILYALFELESVPALMKQVYREDDDIWKQNVLSIGECNDQGYLMVGIGEQNAESIYIEYGHKNPRMTKIADNIFDFFLGHTIRPVVSDLPDGVDLSRLYKNYGEDFWRIRDF